MLLLKLTRVDLIIKLKTFLWSHHNHANIQIENVYRHGKSISKLNTRLYACWKTRDIWSHGVVVCPEIVVCLWPEITTCGFLCQHIYFGPLLLFVAVNFSVNRSIYFLSQILNYRSLLYSSHSNAKYTLALFRFVNNKSRRHRKNSVNHQQGLQLFACAGACVCVFVCVFRFWFLLCFVSLLLLMNIAHIFFPSIICFNVYFMHKYLLSIQNSFASVKRQSEKNTIKTTIRRT